MAIFLTIIAALEAFGGVVVFITSKSAVHEILGALLLGFAFLTLGLGWLLDAAHETSEVMRRTLKHHQDRAEMIDRSRPPPPGTAPSERFLHSRQ